MQLRRLPVTDAYYQNLIAQLPKYCDSKIKDQTYLHIYEKGTDHTKFFYPVCSDSQDFILSFFFFCAPSFYSLFSQSEKKKKAVG